eukprot:SAG11_NODE_38617_length_251_cov_1.289474_1_plen_20_part_01
MLRRGVLRPCGECGANVAAN